MPPPTKKTGVHRKGAPAAAKAKPAKAKANQKKGRRGKAPAKAVAPALQAAAESTQARDVNDTPEWKQLQGEMNVTVESDPKREEDTRNPTVLEIWLSTDDDSDLRVIEFNASEEIAAVGLICLYKYFLRDKQAQDWKRLNAKRINRSLLMQRRLQQQQLCALNCAINRLRHELDHLKKQGVPSQIRDELRRSYGRIVPQGEIFCVVYL